MLTRRHLGWLALICYVLESYGSLVPFNWTALTESEWHDRWSVFMALDTSAFSRGDMVLNFVMGVPLGFLLLGTLGYGRRWRVSLLCFFPVLLVCVFLAFTLEYLQFCFPPRNPSLVDVFTQVLGGSVGEVMWCVGGRWLLTLAQKSPARVMLTAYIFTLVAAYLFPLNLTLSPADIYAKWKHGGFYFIPFQAWENWMDAVMTLTWEALGGMTLGALIRYSWHLPTERMETQELDLTRSHGSLNETSLAPGEILFLFSAALIVPVLCCAVTVISVSRVTDVTNIIFGVFFTFLGWKLAKNGFFRFQDSEGPFTAENGDYFIPQRTHWMFLCFIWGLELIVRNVRPLEFNISVLQGLERISKLSWIPGQDYHQLTPFHLIYTTHITFFEFFILGAMAFLAWGDEDDMRRNVGLAMVLSLADFLILLGKSMQLDRNPRITDALVGLLGVYAGMGVFYWIRTRRRIRKIPD